MEFASANPSVVRSIKQRVLLDTWLRALGRSRDLPVIGSYRPEGIAEELNEMMGFDVVGENAGARFLITQEGARLATAYGNEHSDPAQRINRYLDDAVGPAQYARVVSCYRACVVRMRPVYTISTVQDADGKDVSFERLLLPFGSADRVQQIVGSYKAISIEGGFNITNLMGIKPRATPVVVIRAVIDQDFFPGLPGQASSGDVIELN